MSSSTAALAIMDMTLAAMEFATKATQLRQKAEAEGREVSWDDHGQLVEESKAARAAWDEATKHGA